MDFRKNRRQIDWLSIGIGGLVILLLTCLGFIAYGNLTNSFGFRYIPDSCGHYGNTPLKDVPAKCVDRYIR